MELRSVLTSTRVGELSLTVPRVLKPGATVGEAAAAMREASHGTALIGEGRRLSGIFTERDLLRVISEGASLETPLSQVMTASPRTASSDDTLFDVIRLMDQGGYRRVPVIDADGSPVGIVDVKSISHHLVEHFPATIYNQASHAQQLARKSEGA